MLTVEGELDDISGSGQTRAAHDLCTGIAKSQRHHLEVPGAGHYGIFAGRRWREVVYPEVTSFILAHDQSQKRAVAHERANEVTAEDKIKIDPPKAKTSVRVTRKVATPKKDEAVAAPGRSTKARAAPSKATKAAKAPTTTRAPRSKAAATPTKAAASWP